MRVLFVQQDHVSPVGPVGEAFAERGYDVETFGVVPAERFRTPDVSVAFPQPTEYDVIVPMGAPWSVNDQAAIGTWLSEELDLLRRADAEGVPVFGICFGGQALAVAHGGRVERMPEPEIGWVDVRSEDESIVDSGPWFQWHYDRWVAPPGAREVAGTDRSSQAFVLRRNLAVQFHPEMTAAQLSGWLDHGGAADLRARGLSPSGLLAQTRATEAAAAERTRRLVHQFLDTLAR
jgi:GMP synthase-like glutamine amidotransferase